MSGHEEDEGPGERDAHCPLSPAVGAGCTAIATLPATEIAAVSWVTGSYASRAADAVGRDLLLTHGLFRPPRA
jgi:hypothetical protein